MMMQRLFWFMTCGALVLAGCSKSLPANPTTYPVRGKVVTADGEPVHWVIVHFEQDGEGADADGWIKEDGIFEMKTYGTQGGKPDGAVKGKYKVTLEPFDPTRWGKQEKDLKSKPTPIPSKYKEPKTSGLTFTVEAKDNDMGTIKLEK